MTSQVQNILVYIIGAATLLIILVRLYRARRRGNSCAGCRMKEHCSVKRPEAKKPEKGFREKT